MESDRNTTLGALVLFAAGAILAAMLIVVLSDAGSSVPVEVVQAPSIVHVSNLRDVAPPRVRLPNVRRLQLLELPAERKEREQLEIERGMRHDPIRMRSLMDSPPGEIKFERDCEPR